MVELRFSSTEWRIKWEYALFYGLAEGVNRASPGPEVVSAEMGRQSIKNGGVFDVQ